MSLAISSLTLHHLRSLIRSCARRSSLSAGKTLHAALVTSGLDDSPDTFLRNVLLHFYAASGELFYARQLFDGIPGSHKDAADWTALMGAFSRTGLPQEGLRLFLEMRRSGERLDDVALLCVLGACSQLRAAEVGAQVHCHMEKAGFSAVKPCNAVMDLYVKCGLLGKVRRVFENMTERSVVSWTVLLDGVVSLEGVEGGRAVFDAMPEKNEVAWTIMVVGYVGDGLTHEGFLLLAEMIFACRLRLNFVTLCSVLSASGQSGDVAIGRWIHVYALKTVGKEMGVMVETALVDCYAKCGRVDSAFRVFKHMSTRNAVAWNAMLSGLAMHGRGKLALDLFPQMVKEAKPDDLTFTSLLSACSHSGLVEEGRHCFRSLESTFGVTPKLEHYSCMVDLLGRSGRVEEALNLVDKMPVPPNEVVLGSLLGSCSVHGQPELGERVLKELFKLSPHNTEYHILLSNMYARQGKSETANSVRTAFKNRGIRKVPGTSSIHVDGQVHRFNAGDRSHPRISEVYAMLGQMIRKLRLAGYVPNIDSQVSPGCDLRETEDVEQALFSHSEKLAVCFGLITTRAGSSLYIFKNLRICVDCHSAMKIVSEVYGREIVVRDRNRFHCFKQGSCSCSDRW